MWLPEGGYVFMEKMLKYLRNTYETNIEIRILQKFVLWNWIVCDPISFNKKVFVSNGWINILKNCEFLANFKQNQFLNVII